ncbi:ATP-binding protein [Sulfuricurvum sp.]|uniref:ATP-binding protein n=1 Tax=Sulfuricurvum sp. TaxID=2025608 RepID=UPI002E32830B|nr:ATP-binding protein [Sulfuricurvum sp.]HEX5330263.1 ATP-binding protein [Sulfuricurvum sp.]
MKKYYYGAVAFYLIALFGYITYQYTTQRSELIAFIDKRLIQCASVTDQLLPPSLHTPETKFGSISPEQDRENRLKLSRFAESVTVKYVYSFVLQEGKVYFTSSSATAEELKSGEDISYYFDEYTDASPILLKAFQTRTMQFDESADQWGHFRSVFLPHISPSGRVYITAADIEITNIDAQLHKLLMQSLGEALFYILILIPFFIAYRMQNKGIQQELSRQVAERTADLEERSIAVTRLLDNANQGFLTFSLPLVVENEYSQKCLEIFERPIENERIGKLFYPDESEKREFFEETFQAVFDESDEVKVDAILSLLPHEFVINNKAIDVVYKIIEANRAMVILTDITDKKNLEKSIERERNVLKMVVSAIGNRDEFFELLDDYRHFLANRFSCIDTKLTPMENLTELYRQIHTYKGLFAQQEFVTTLQALHKVETKFASWLHGGGVSNMTLQAMMNKIDFELWLEKDLGILRETLGEEFLEKKERVMIDDTSFERLHGKMAELIKEQPDTCYELNDLLELLQRLKFKPIGECFSTLPKYVEQLAERLEKSLYPMEIEDKTSFSVGEEFRGFAKSLIHVIRNSVDHGIESPEERAEHDKDESGTIHLAITEDEENIMIEIADDGRGIDKEKLKQKAIETGIKTALELENDEALMDLLFEDYFSTKEEVSDISGRGIGLASVRAQLYKLGGSYRVISDVGIGTQFLFSIPKKSLTKE